MSAKSKISNALISVFYKDGLEPIVKLLHQAGVVIYSTGGTQEFIEKLGIPVVAVEQLTGYPSILGGRVKTLHPKIFGGILNRQDNESDVFHDVALLEAGFDAKLQGATWHGVAFAESICGVEDVFDCSKHFSSLP